MQVHELTKEVLAEIYEGEAQFAGVYKNGKFLGTYPELRKKYLDNQDKGPNKSLLVDKFIQKMKDTIPGIEIFKNKSQPNIILKNCKVYLIVGPAKLHQLSITHNTLTYEELDKLLPYNSAAGKHNKHILISGLTIEDIQAIVKILGE